MGPVSVWITAAGWAEAARDRFGHAWLITPEGVLSPSQARALATRPATATRKRSTWRRLTPRAVGTLKKDLRDLVRAIRFQRAAAAGPWDNYAVALIWQHHELFHRAGLVAARRLSSPLVVFVDAPIVWEGEQWGVRRPGWGGMLERLGERPQLRRADVVACVSDDVAAQVARLGVDERRIAVTPCSVDVEHFKRAPSASELRSRLNMADSFVIGWVGSFRRFHGLELLLTAYASIKQSIPHASLLLVGDGLDRPRIMARAAALQLADVTFTGTVPHADIPVYMSAMDAAVIIDPGTGSFHYSPLKLKEYMACGLAVVAPRSGQLTDLLVDGTTALTVPPGDAGALATALQHLHGSPGVRHTLGQSAREWVLAHGTWSRQLEHVVQRLEDLRRSGLLVAT